MLDGLIANLVTKIIKTLAKAKYTSSYIQMSTQKGCFLSYLGLPACLMLGGINIFFDKKEIHIRTQEKIKL